MRRDRPGPRGSGENTPEKDYRIYWQEEVFIAFAAGLLQGRAKQYGCRMMFLIDRNIALLPAQQVLKNTDTGAEIELNFVATQLLTFLLQHAGTVSSRDDILENVFLHNNASATDGNLNRHIMELRRAFTELHCTEDVIITIPRKGFKLGNVSVRLTETAAAPETPPEYLSGHEPVPLRENTPSAEPKIPRGYVVTAVLSLCFFLGAAGYYFPAQDARISRPDVRIFKTEQYRNCEITYTSGTRYSPPASVINELNRQGETVTCREPLKITLWRNTTPTQQWSFTTLCDSLNKCRGIYVYTQE
ncbi:winged helix-turn-helix domain-containing protein [Enterobacter bugandensis]|uniref:winged helix-turn-helix domain-containing protein n=1 Tax=Enterobacter bugandensis TaxID=881260 RepID=UPI002FD71056